MGLFDNIKEFFVGSPEKRENVSLLRPEQERLYDQLMRATRRRGAGGAFGKSSDYYRDLMSDDSADYEAFAAPMMRNYYQDIVPGLAEQFAGMGSGGLSSSGFRNAQIQGATDLSERLGALRANLRQSGAQGLQNIGQLGLNPYSQNMVTQGASPGLFSSLSPTLGSGIASSMGSRGWFGGGQNSGSSGQNSVLSGLFPIIGSALGTAVGGPVGGAIGGGFGSIASGLVSDSRVGAKSSPYGSGPKPSPSAGGFQLPTYLQGTKWG